MVVFLEKILSYSVILIAFYYISENNAEDSCCDCPYSPPNVTSSEVQKYYRDLIVKVWDNPSITKHLTCLGLKLRTKILEFLKCLDTPASRFAILTSYRFMRAAPSIEFKLNRCSWATAINATANGVDGDPKFINETLDLYATYYRLSNDRNAVNARYTSGCDGKICNSVSPNPVTLPVSCYKNGFVYNINGMWNRPEVKEAGLCEIKKLVLELYYSCVYADKLFAILATLALNPMSQRLFVNTSGNIIIESMMFYLSPPVQQCCCYQRTERIKSFYIEYGKEVDRAVAEERKRTVVKTCKK